MGTLRFLGIAVGLLLACLGIQWLLAPRPLQPDARVPTFQRVDVNSPRYQMETTSYAGDHDAVRDALRRATLEAAQAFRDDPCNDAIKARYVEAATKYARAWLSIAPCVATATCGASDGPRLDRAQKAFGSPLDRRVREAMTKAHQTDAIAEGDFSGDVAPFVAEMAADPVINPRAAPRMKEVARDFRTPSTCRAASVR
jgi:hypothetical protein